MKIDIGSGPHPKPDCDVWMDYNPWPYVNCIHDITSVPYPFETGTFEKAYMGDVLEHISIFEVDKVLREVYRIMEPSAMLEVTVPDARWIFERIIQGDWKEQANVDWLNTHETDWDNAMSYLFGGFHNKNEYKIPGMGHVNAFDTNSLTKLLMRNGFIYCSRIVDDRNPIPARHSVLRMVCRKPDEKS